MAKKTLSDQRRKRNKKMSEPIKKLRPGDLLLAERLSDGEVDKILRPYGFQDTKGADANLQGMAEDPRFRRLLARCLEEFLEAIAITADPDQALNHWEQYLRSGINRVQLFEYFQQSPRMRDVLCSVFGNVPNLAQTLIRDPLLIYWLAEEQVLTDRPTKQSFEMGIQQILTHLNTDEVKLDALRRYKRREILRIGVRDLLSLASVEETIAVLSDLAGVLLQATLAIVSHTLQMQYGKPVHHCPKRGEVETEWVVMAMGKLGGGELNFSSDVDLIYVYETDDGVTQGISRSKRTSKSSPDSVLSNEEYFEYLARAFTNAVDEITQEGYVFRVDLRLRAEGSVGKLARSVKDYEEYYFSRGQVWERMALLKAFPIAGSPAVGKKFLKAVRPFIVGTKKGKGTGSDRDEILSEVKAIKRMIDEQMAHRKQEVRNVKLGFGGIREIEFTVQTLQILYGKTLPAIINRSTLATLRKLGEKGILSLQDEKQLRKSYLFLRDIEHKLQMVDDLQTHALPENQEELVRHAIRLGYDNHSKKGSLKEFLKEYRDTTTFIHKVFVMVVSGSKNSSLLKNAAWIR